MYTECFKQNNCLTLLILVVSCISLSKSDSGSQRIVNGTESKVHEFPFMAGLYSQIINPYVGNYELVCGGTLVTKRHVVTAAHCMDSKQRYSVHLGGHLSEYDFDAARFSVSKWKTHPDFCCNISTGYSQNDIAVLTLNEDVNFNYYKHVKPIALPKMDDLRTGETCTVIGWGQLTYNDTPLSTVLRKLEMKILSETECRQYLTPKYIVDGNSCLYKELAGICFGDSGGPVVCGKAPYSLSFFGVASGAGMPCGDIDSVSIYGRVGYKPFLDFITKIIRQDLGKETTTTTTSTTADPGNGVSYILGNSKLAAVSASAAGIISNWIVLKLFYLN